MSAICQKCCKLTSCYDPNRAFMGVNYDVFQQYCTPKCSVSDLDLFEKEKALQCFFTASCFDVTSACMLCW